MRFQFKKVKKVRLIKFEENSFKNYVEQIVITVKKYLYQVFNYQVNDNFLCSLPINYLYNYNNLTSFKD